MNSSEVFSAESEIRRCIAETIILTLGTSKFASNLWLASYPSDIGKTINYIYRPDEKILPGDGFVPGQRIMTTGFTEAFLSYLKLLFAPGLLLTEKSVRSSEDRGCNELIIELEARMNEMMSPIIMVFSENVEEIFPEKLIFSPTSIKAEPVEVFFYPTENMAARDYAEILQKLELINDYSYFAEAYAIISRHACDGTNFSVRLKEECLERKIPFSESRISAFERFASDRRMAAKWEKYKKRHGAIKADWQGVTKILSSFVCPVWKAIIDDNVFFGDWMPELGRYLDA